MQILRSRRTLASRVERWLLLVLVCICLCHGRAGQLPPYKVVLANELSRRPLQQHHQSASTGCFQGQSSGTERREDNLWCGETSAGPHQHPVLATIMSVSFLVGIIIFILVCMS